MDNNVEHEMNRQGFVVGAGCRYGQVEVITT